MESVEVRVAVLEKIVTEQETRIALQLGRIIADIESEKGTRQRLHTNWQKECDSLHARLLSLEKHVAIGMGVVIAAQVLVPVILKVLHP